MVTKIYSSLPSLIIKEIKSQGPSKWSMNAFRGSEKSYHWVRKKKITISHATFYYYIILSCLFYMSYITIIWIAIDL